MVIDRWLAFRYRQVGDIMISDRVDSTMSHFISFSNGTLSYMHRFFEPVDLLHVTFFFLCWYCPSILRCRQNPH